MKTLFLVIVWLIVCLALWLFATSLKVDNEKYKYLEFRFKSIFYWMVAILSLIIGTLI